MQVRELTATTLLYSSEAKLKIPLNFERGLLNMIDHKLVIEVEIEANKETELRLILNVNTLDKCATFCSKQLSDIKKYTVPVIKL